jgi:hypothetical protein
MTASKTTNGASSWTRYHLSTTAGMAFSSVLDPSNSNIVYIGGSTGMFKTTNAGSSWFNTTNGISDTIFDIAIDQSSTNTLYAATLDGVFKTTNGGTNWTNTGCSGARAVLIDPDDSDQIYAGTSSGVYSSAVGGGSWTSMSDGLNGSHVTSLGINPGVYLFAGTDDAAMFRWSLQVGVAENEDDASSAIFLSVHPNPARIRTSIEYAITTQSHVQIALYDVQGRHICTLVDAHHVAGTYCVSWSGRDSQDRPVAAGIYMCRMTTDTEVTIQKLVLFQ